MNKQQIEKKAREFYWRRNPNKMIAENTRPDLVVGYVQGFNEAASMMYSKEDMITALNEGFELGKTFDEDNPSISLSALVHLHDNLQSLKQQTEL